MTTGLLVLTSIVAIGALLVSGRTRAHLLATQRRISVLTADGEAGTFVDALDRQRERVDDLVSRVESAEAAATRTRAEASAGLRNVAVVRYDAFGDLGGRLSFSLAVLDDTGNGFVLTAIHGRSETREYVKAVIDRNGDVPLSPEEEQAVAGAMSAPRK